MNPYLVQVWDIKNQTYLKTKSFTSKRQAFKYAEEMRNTGFGQHRGEPPLDIRDGYEYSAHVYEYLPTEIG
jgi:hypothetical protein